MPRNSYFYDLLRKIGLSDFGARTGQFIFERPLRLAFIVALAFLAARIGARLARHFVNRLASRSALRRPSAWAEQRTRTMGGVLGSLVRIVVWSVAAVYAFDVVGFNPGPLVAASSIVGVALGFGAQSMIKDFLAGFFILVEDQYSVGDVVTVSDTVTGTIEEVSLRATRLRAVDGTVWYVPNGEIRRVGNSNKDWSRVLIDVEVPYDADVAAVNTAIAEEARGLADDPEVADSLLEPPEVWGVEAIGADGYCVRVAAKTLPGEKPAVGRALRARISARLHRDGLVKGPQSVMVVSTADAASPGAAASSPDAPGEE